MFEGTFRLISTRTMAQRSPLCALLLLTALNAPASAAQEQAAAPQASPQVVAPQTAAPVQAPPAALAPAPLLRFDPAEIDFGDVYYGEPLRGKARITNVSGKDVPIQEVKTSCGCTVAKLRTADGQELIAKVWAPGKPRPDPVATLKPGETLDVDVEVKPPAAMKGHIQKFVEALFVDKNQPMEQLSLRANVGLAYEVDPSIVQVGIVHKQGVVERTVQVTANVPGDWDIDGFEAGNDGETLPVGMKFEVLDKEGKTRRVKMLWDGPRATGSATVKVHIKIKGQRVPWAEFATYGVVQSDLTFDNNDPETAGGINFGTMAVGTKVTKTITITNGDESIPYLLDSIEIQSNKPQYFTTQIRKLKEGASYAVDITCDAGIADPFFRGAIVLHARHPEEPAKRMNFSGRVAPG